MENDAAVGVETADGSIFRARRFIVSGLNPQQTFLELIDEDLLPRANGGKSGAGVQVPSLIAPLFALNVNLKEPPLYAAADKNSELARALMVILGLEGLPQYPDIVRHHEAGTIPPTVMWGSCPTQFDPSQAPPGGHTAFMWEKLPYRLNGDPKNWDGEKDEHGRRDAEIMGRICSEPERLCSRFLHSQCPGILNGKTFPNMREGDLLIEVCLLPTARSATTAPSPAPAITAGTSRTCTCADRPVIPAATSLGCRATTARKLSSVI